ncbi:MAG: RluA family pseudouridine synthase [Saprospiraceae bacterium]
MAAINKEIIRLENLVDSDLVWKLPSSLNDLDLPDRFTFPFYYEPHPLTIEASKILQNYLQSQEDWEHNFGLEEGMDGLVIGKMFGVLVVQKEDGSLGFLAAFSGKLAGGNHHKGFVPPVFDILTEGGFFRTGEDELNAINRKIEALEVDENFLQLSALLKKEKETAEEELEGERNKMKAAKKARKERRENGRQSLPPEQFERLQEELKNESLGQRYVYKKMSKEWNEKLDEIESQLKPLQEEIAFLKKDRKKKSSALQRQLFEQYYFLNQAGKKKSLADIFELAEPSTPPSGAGECAAPKLLQYAFLHNLKPIAMAEFWWGQSPSSEIRKHGHFYPACRGKCEPILGHMLEGIETDDNPMLESPTLENDIETIYEDDFLLVINKPAEFLSVPGKQITDSIYERMKNKFPYASGPLVVHRLDMSTSGIMLISKSKDSHKYLQEQFIKRKVKKRYVALLDGIIAEDKGLIDLPLRVDLDDRPRQLVCYEYGKPAQTQWKVLERKDGKTRIHFFHHRQNPSIEGTCCHPKGSTLRLSEMTYGTKANQIAFAC